MRPLSITYRLSIPAPATHMVDVEMQVSAPEGLPAGLVARMPVWTPGSYLVREYARHVEHLTVDTPALVRKIRKNAWQIETGGAAQVVVRYRVYGSELTVRTNHVDEDHASLVGAALFLGVDGCEDSALAVEVAVPKGWEIVTPLMETGEHDSRVRRFRAPDFDTLVDSPIEIGNHREERFDVEGHPHRYAICPGFALSPADVKRLVDDTKAIVQTEARLFGGALPYDAYDLVLHLSSRGRGGLEHRSSASLIVAASSFAKREGYLDVLSLVAHEIFHAWNIKRIRPAGLSPYRYDEECYTRSLWWFEGGTSYYDWRVLALAHLCTTDEYLDHLAAEFAYLDQTPGRLVHSLEDASFDAWIKLYRPDENSANSTVSYYRKGEVVCALLDLELRARSNGQASLDSVLLHLWREYGVVDRPVPEDALQAIFEHASGVDLGDLFDAWIRSPAEVQPANTLARVGLAIERTPRAESPPCSLGVRLRADGGRTVVSSVMRSGAAWRAGLNAGDEIVAMGGQRVEGASVDTVLRARAPGDTLEAIVVRDGRVTAKNITLDPARPDRVKIVPQRDPSPRAREAFAAWLGQPHPATASGARA